MKKVQVLLIIIAILTYNGSCKESRKVGADVYNPKDYFSISKYPPALIEKISLETNKTYTIAGKLRLVGNMPFTKLVLTPETDFDVEIKFSSKKEKKLINEFQGKFLQITGKIVIIKMTDPNGRFLHNLYEIYPQKIKRITFK